MPLCAWNRAGGQVLAAAVFLAVSPGRPHRVRLCGPRQRWGLWHGERSHSKLPAEGRGRRGAESTHYTHALRRLRQGTCPLISEVNRERPAPRVACVCLCVSPFLLGSGQMKGRAGDTAMGETCPEGQNQDPHQDRFSRALFSAVQLPGQLPSDQLPTPGLPASMRRNLVLLGP